VLAHKLLTIDYLQQSIDFKKKIYIAFSGGIDSSVLVDILGKNASKLKLNITVIHVNHNISSNSLTWMKHCKEFCSKLGLNFISEEVNIISSGGGIESAARKARYKIFSKYLKNEEQILTAHHMNDVTETIFLRLLRGTGIDGLSGLEKSRKLGKGLLIRPFLEVSKKEIEEYAKENDINYIFDETNKDNEYDRNFLRNEIFPKLDARWNDFSSRVFKMSKITNERNNNFFELLNNNYGYLINNVIKIKDLKNLNIDITKEIIRTSIKNENISIPNSRVLDEIIKTFILSNPTSKSIVSWSRADKDQRAGKITYKEGNIFISTNE
tara:strand:+ start:440 stop:1414 length:975 start_codon:yes stop_codon:yes gene_type:complete